MAEAPFDVTHGESTVTVTRWMQGIEPPPFWAKQLPKPGLVDRWQIIRFEAPCTVNHRCRRRAGRDRRAGGRSLAGRQRLWCSTPSRRRPRRTCHYFWAFVRNHRLTEQRLTTEIREGVAGIFREDEIILEAQQRAMDENPDRVFYNLNIDAGAMWARRVIDRMVAARPPHRAAGGGVSGMAEREADRSVSQTVRAQLALRDLILSGGLRPGERISELQAVETTGVSRTPVRMALVRLEEEGSAGGDPVRRLHGEGLFRARHSRFHRAARHPRGRWRRACRRARRVGARSGTAEGNASREIDELVRQDPISVEAFSSYVALNARFHALLAELSRSRR